MSENVINEITTAGVSLPELVIEQACQRLIKQFSWYNDHEQFEDLVALFIPEGRYARPIAPQEIIIGRADILKSFTSRPKERVGRHLVTNINVVVQDANHASATCYVVLFSGTKEVMAPKFGLLTQGGPLIGEYHDSFVLTEEGWRFEERKGLIVLSN